MMQPHVHLAYAPRGAGVMCAMFYVANDADVYGWYCGARANEQPASFFMLEYFYSTHATAFYRTHVSDVYADWYLAFPPIEQPTDQPPVPEAICHELEHLQDVFAREWLFYSTDADRAKQTAAYRSLGLPLQGVNIDSQRLNKLVKEAPVWTYSTHGFDLNVLEHLAANWSLDYRPQ